MKQYEIRTKDSAPYVLPGDIDTNAGAGRFYEIYQWAERGGTLVLHEFESESEADKARLTWLESTYRKGNIISSIRAILATPNCTAISEAIDSARQAPQPKVTVIATPEGAG